MPSRLRFSARTAFTFAALSACAGSPPSTSARVNGAAKEPPAECSEAYWQRVQESARIAGVPAELAVFERAACVARSERGSLEWVTVSPEGAPSFAMRVEGSPVSVIPGVGTEPSEVLVRGLLVFRGRSHIEDYGFPSGSALHGGRVLTGQNTRVLPRRVQAGSVRADLRLTNDVRVFDTDVPCASLTVTVSPRQRATRTESDNTRQLRTSRTALYPGPQAGSAIEISSPHLAVHEIGTTRARVRQEFDDGALLTGWIPRDAVGAESGGGPGQGIALESCGCPADPRPRLRIALKAGVGVYAHPGKGLWASVGSSLELDGVEAGPGWLALSSLAGLGFYERFTEHGGCTLLHAFVRRDDVEVVR